jgi:hypothetical protein
MKSKVKVTKTGKDECKIRLTFDILFQAKDESAREQACDLLGRLLREAVPEAKRQELLAQLEKAEAEASRA